MIALRTIIKNYLDVSKIGLIDLIFGMTKEGISSFLILYLVQTLHFTDQAAYGFIGVKEIIFYIIPFSLAVMTSSFMKLVESALVGMSLMGLGCLILSYPSIICLNIGIGFFILGYGLGKPTIPLLISIPPHISLEKKDLKIRYLYAFGSLAAFLSPLLMGVLGNIKSWNYSFSFLAILCLLGTFFSYYVFKREGYIKDSIIKNIFSRKGKIFFLPFTLSIPFFFPSIKNALVIGCLLWIIGFIVKIWGNFTREEKNLFLKFTCVISTIIIFFAFQTQEYTLYPLFIERFVDKKFLLFEIKTPWFHTIAPLLTIIAAPFLIRYYERRKLPPDELIYKKILWSFISLSLSFVSIYLSTYFSQIALLLAVISYGLFFIGAFSLIPTSQEIINRFNSETLRRSLMGVLYVSMALARFIGTLISQSFLKKTAMLVNMDRISFQQSFLILIFLLVIILSLFSIFYHYAKKRSKV